MITDFFKIEEIVCLHVFYKYGQQAWTFFDPRLFIVIESIRQRLNKRILINNWRTAGPFSQRGLRCIQCQFVKDAIISNQLYLSPHMTGQALDFDIEGLVASEVRQWIFDNKNLLPYPVRLENNTDWIHLDIRNNTDEKVIFFNA